MDLGNGREREEGGQEYEIGEEGESGREEEWGSRGGERGKEV